MAEDLYASKGTGVLATTVVFTSLAFFFILLRFYTRSWISYSLGPEDWIVAFAMACSITLTVLIALEVKYGTGRHFTSLDPVVAGKALKPTYISVPIYNASLTLIKCSLILQYLRLFVTPYTRKVCWAVLAVVGTYGVINVFTSIFICRPIAFFWDSNIPGGKCFSFTAIYFSNASFNILSDLVILAIPIPVVRSLHLPKRQKIGLGLIFGVGAFACVTSVLRLHSLYVFSTSRDQTWDNAEVATWSSVETNVGIICACLPTLKPLFVRFVPRLLGSSRTRGPSNNYSGYGDTNGSRWRARAKSTPLSSKSATHGAMPLSDRSPTEHKHDIEYGYTVDGGDSGTRDSKRHDRDGQIKVVQVIQVEHEQNPGPQRSSPRNTHRSGSGDSSEISLIIDK